MPAVHALLGLLKARAPKLEGVTCPATGAGREAGDIVVPFPSGQFSPVGQQLVRVLSALLTILLSIRCPHPLIRHHPRELGAATAPPPVPISCPTARQRLTAPGQLGRQ